MDKQKTKEFWDKLTDEARQTMEARISTGTKAALIAIGAQHPLVDGCRPGPAFQARLDRGIELYNQLTAQGYVAMFFIPGSRHVFNGIADKISLSEAGTRYLIEQGIDEDDIFGVNACIKYRGEFGVYNSSDETLVGAKIFLDNSFTELYAIVSPVQGPRVELLYTFRGVLPKVITVPVADAVHGLIGEITEVLPLVLENPAYMDDPTSERCQKHRKGRVPEDNKIW